MTNDPGGDDEVSDRYASWYESSDALAQGTVLRGTRVYEEAAQDDPSGKPKVVPRSIDGIILTQTCDIPKPAQNRLLVAQIQLYRDIAEQRGGYFRKERYREELRAGVTISEFLLPPASGYLDDWSVVNFRELFTVNRSRVQSGDGYIGLASPYREHLGQAFARFMMRVGLPQPFGNEFVKYQLDSPK
jgi:hypothetical protein